MTYAGPRPLQHERTSTPHSNGLKLNKISHLLVIKVSFLDYLLYSISLNNVLGHSPSQSAPTILNYRAPCFLKIGHPAFWKKQAEKTGSFFIQKEKRPGCLFSFWITMTLVFCTLFFSKSRVPDFQKAGCPIFKNSGCRLTGRVWLFDDGWQLAQQSLQICNQAGRYKHKKIVGFCIADSEGIPPHCGWWSNWLQAWLFFKQTLYSDPHHLFCFVFYFFFF